MAENTVSAVRLTADKHDEQMQPQSNILCSGFNRYRMYDVCGEGAFGKVVNAVNMKTSKEVALKFLKREQCAPREIMMLDALSALDPYKTNVVHFKERFQVRGQTCLVFERLDMNLQQLLEHRHGCPLSLSEIRPIAYQLLIAFEALKSIGLVHTDIKPNNVMLVDHECVPFRVKLIDFGLSFMTSENTYGNKTQPKGYRSPEDALGLLVSEAIDMWGLGCVLLFLYLANHPFSVKCEYQGVKGFVDMLGLPEDHLLEAGLYTSQFFIEDQHWGKPGWWLKTPSEYKQETGVEPKEWTSDIRRLEDLITLHPVLNGHRELQDRRAFVSLLTGLLQIDQKRRLTPEMGLKHPFLSMVHLMDNTKDLYSMDCLHKMVFLDWSLCSYFTPWALSDDTGSAAPQSLDRVEDLDHPCDVTAAAEEPAESHHVPQTQLCEEAHPARVSRRKRMRKFSGKRVKRVL